MSLHRGPRAAAIASALGVCAALGCSDRHPTDAPAERLLISDSLASSLQLVLDDAQRRIVPGLSLLPGRARLDSAFASLRTAVDSRDRRVLESAVDSADAALATYALSSPPDASSGDQAELDVLRLVVDDARMATNGRPTPAR